MYISIKYVCRSLSLRIHIWNIQIMPPYTQNVHMYLHYVNLYLYRYLHLHLVGVAASFLEALPGRTSKPGHVLF